MKQLLRATVLAVFGCLVVPAFAVDEKKDVDKKPDAKKDVDKKDTDKKDPDKKDTELVAAGSVTGKLVTVDETKKTIKLKIDIPELNQSELQAINTDTIEIQKVLATERNPANRIRRVQELQNRIAGHKAKLYKIGHKDVDLTATDDVKVRLLNPTTKFDEKGKVVPYTKDELKELKGDDPKAIGYKAEFSDLRPNQIVKVVLMKKKGSPPRPKPDPNKKDVDKAALADLASEYAPHVTMIIIVADPPSQ